MKIFKYLYGLFVLSIFFFIGGIIADFITMKQVRHIPFTLLTSIVGFMLLIFGLIHLGIYKKISAEKYLMRSAKIVYWFGMLLFMFFLDELLFPFHVSVKAVYEKLIFLYYFSHPILLAWLIIDQFFFSKK